jgi:hypothetical protein
MCLVYPQIQLINEGNLELARRHFIVDEEVRKMNVTGLVDTGS